MLFDPGWRAERALAVKHQCFCMGKRSYMTSSQKESVNVSPTGVEAWSAGCAGVSETCLGN